MGDFEPPRRGPATPEIEGRSLDNCNGSNTNHYLQPPVSVLKALAADPRTLICFFRARPRKNCVAYPDDRILYDAAAWRYGRAKFRCTTQHHQRSDCPGKRCACSR